MNKNPNRTIADIVAEKRAQANKIECAAGRDANLFQRELISSLRAEADELEAAMKRERERIEADALTVGAIVEASRKSEMSKNMSKNGADFGQLGNAAALREAVEGAKEKALYISRHYTTPNSLTGNMLELLASLNAALAAPPRNCDAPYNDRVEMYGAFKDWCKSKGHTMEPMLAYDAFDWLLAPATKKGGDDGIQSAS